MKRLIDPEGRFAALIEPTISGMGYELLRVRTVSASKGITLQIMIEFPDGRAVNVDDCTAVSRAVGAILDVEDPISDAYRLEISSAGVPRPMTRVKDFKDYVGFNLKCEIDPMVNNRKRFSGILTAAGDDSFVIRDDENREFELAYAQLSSASLIYSDALLAYEQQRAKLPDNPFEEPQTVTGG